MSVVTLTILSNGKAIGPEWEVLGLDVRREVNRVPAATISFAAGSIAQRDFPLSAGGLFTPGAEVEIRSRFEGQPGSEKTLFKGNVIRHGLAAQSSGSRLIVDLKDQAVVLTGRRETRVFVDKKPEEAVKALLGDYGLKAGKLSLPATVFPELTQYNCSPWDFLVSLADSAGCWVVTEDGRISIVPPPTSGASKLKLECGLSEIYDFELEIDGQDQCGKVTTSAWDPKEMKPLTGNSRTFDLSVGKDRGGKVSQAIGFKDPQRFHAGSLTKEELNTWASAELVRRRVALFRGRVSTLHLPGSRLLDIVELAGFGNRFNGTAPITGLAHRLWAGGSRTDLQFGRPAASFAERPDLVEPAAAGLLPGIESLQIGVVQAFKEDPDKLFRVRIELPGAGGEKVELWARWLSPDAGKERGWYFYPEPGDEVLIGFLNGDARQPVVLGSFFNKKNPTPGAFGKLDNKNLKKGLVSRKGVRLEINDADKPSLTLETPAGHRLVMDDDAKSIEITDANKNKIILNADGITLKSAKKLVLEASGEVEIKGSKVDVK